MSLSVSACMKYFFWVGFVTAAFSVPVSFGDIIVQLLITGHLKDIFHVNFMGLL